MQDHMRRVLIAVLLSSVLAVMAVSVAHAQGDPAFQKKVAIYHEKINAQKTRVDHWRAETTAELWLLVSVAMLGGVAAALQAVTWQYSKVCTALVGAAVSALTIYSDNGFDADRKSLVRASATAEELIQQAEDTLDDIDPNAFEDLKQANLDKVRDKLTQLYALQPDGSAAAVPSPTRTTGVLQWLDGTLRAQSRQPNWVTHPPVDDNTYNYYVGQATESSVAAAREASLQNALTAAAKRIGSAAPVDVFSYLKSISKVVDTFIAYDSKTGTVTFWTLLSAPKELSNAQAVAQLADEDYVTVFRKGVKASQARDWKSAAQAMQTAIQRQPPSGNLVKQVNIQGVRSEPYVPHFYLAAAYVELNDCPRAADALLQAETEVQGTALSSPLKAYKAKCSRQPGTSESPRR